MCIVLQFFVRVVEDCGALSCRGMLARACHRLHCGSARLHFLDRAEAVCLLEIGFAPVRVIVQTCLAFVAVLPAFEERPLGLRWLGDAAPPRDLFFLWWVREVACPLGEA